MYGDSIEAEMCTLALEAKIFFHANNRMFNVVF